MYRFVDRWVCGQVLTQADQLDVRAGQRLVAAGARVQVLGAVLDHDVIRPVPRTGPPTALHLAT